MPNLLGNSPVDSPAQAGLLAQQALPGAESAPKQAAPEEQASYEAFIENGMLAIYDEKRSEQILKMLSGQDPVTALSNTVLTVIHGLVDAATRKQQTPPSDTVLIHGGYALLQELAQMGKSAGVLEITDEQINKAGEVAMQKYLEQGIRTGKVDVNQLASDYKQLKGGV